jgi:hypothetical protein
MTKDAKILEIKEKVEALIEKAIEILEENYDMDSFEEQEGAYMIMLDLNSVICNLFELTEEGLKIED